MTPQEITITTFYCKFCNKQNYFNFFLRGYIPDICPYCCKKMDNIDDVHFYTYFTATVKFLDINEWYFNPNDINVSSF